MLNIKQFKKESKHTCYDFSINYDATDKLPSLFGLTSLSSKKASDLSRAIGIVSDFVVGKFQENNLSLLSRLGALQRDTVDLIMSVPIDEGDEIDFYLGLLAIHKNTFYLYFEQSYFNLFIVRNGKPIWLNKSATTAMFTGSGRLQDGDKIFLLTKTVDVEQALNEDFDISEGAGIHLEYYEELVEDVKPIRGYETRFVPKVEEEQEYDEYEDEDKNEKEVEDPFEKETLIKKEPVKHVEPIEHKPRGIRENPRYDRKKRGKPTELSNKVKPVLEKIKEGLKVFGSKILVIAKDTGVSIYDFFLIKVLKVKKTSIIKNNGSSTKAKIGLVFIVIFVILAVFLIFKSADDSSKEQALKKEYEVLIKDTENRITEFDKKARALNFTALNDVPVIQQGLDKSKTYNKYKNSEKIASLERKLNEDIDQINAVKPIFDEDILTTIAAKYPKAKPTSMTLLIDGTLIALDGTQKTLYQISSKNPLEINEVTIDKFSTPLYVTSIENKVYVYDSTVGVLEVDVAAKTGKVIPGFTNLGTIKDFQSFGGISTGDGRLYLLSDSANKIWRSTQNGSSFSFPGAYNSAKSILPDKASGIAIDGKIFVATANGVLQRYFSGELDSESTIAINGLLKGFSGDVKLVTVPSRQDLNTNFIYLMDPDNSRVLKINKDSMTLEAQYVYRGSKNLFKNLKSIALSADEKTLYVLDSDYIFRLSVSN